LKQLAYTKNKLKMKQYHYSKTEKSKSYRTGLGVAAALCREPAGGLKACSMEVEAAHAIT
jgi:hypothetical protein